MDAVGWLIGVAGQAANTVLEETRKNLEICRKGVKELEATLKLLEADTGVFTVEVRRRPLRPIPSSWALGSRRVNVGGAAADESVLRALCRAARQA